MTGLKYQKNIKRDQGDDAKYAPKNIQYEHNYKPDPDLQQHFYIYCVLDYNFAFAIPYDAGNSNGKMNTRTYIDVILPALRSYILQQGGDYNPLARLRFCTHLRGNLEVDGYSGHAIHS
jgi:hypothetical protein